MRATTWKVPQRLLRHLVVVGLISCWLTNLLLARFHHGSSGFTPTTAFFLADVYHQDAVVIKRNDARDLQNLTVADNIGMAASKHLTTLPQTQRNRYFPSATQDEQAALPRWMQEYFAWHKTQRSLLNASNCKDFRYLVMICREQDKCGGTADRLKPFLLMLLIAYQTKRIFVVSWQQPFPLETFLQPPDVIGLDWRAPDYLLPVIAHNKQQSTTLVRLIRSMNYTKLRCLNVRYQSYDAGQDYFNQYRPKDELKDDVHTFQHVYPHAWRRLFTPILPIANKIESSLQELHLVPGQYLGAHVRAFRGVTTRNPATIRNLTMMALQCVSQLWNPDNSNVEHHNTEIMENIPIFVASDSSLAVQTALAFGKETNATVVARPQEQDDEADPTKKNPLHLERSKTTRNAPKDPTEYYDTFVDLYLLSMSRCVSYNIGGFGHWASLLSYNSSCHFRYSQISVCQWKTPKRGKRSIRR